MRWIVDQPPIEEQYCIIARATPAGHIPYIILNMTTSTTHVVAASGPSPSQSRKSATMGTPTKKSHSNACAEPAKFPSSSTNNSPSAAATSKNIKITESRLNTEDPREGSTSSSSRDVTATASDGMRANALANLRDSISTKYVLSAMLGQEPTEVTKLRDEEYKRRNPPPPAPVAPPPPPPTPLTPNTLVEVLTEDITRGAREVRQDIESIIGSDSVATARVSEREDDDNNASFADTIITDYVPEEVSAAMINMGIISKPPEAKPKTYWEKAEDMFAVDGMTYKQRLIGCGSCMVVGYLLSFGSVFRINALLHGNPLPYILTATMGNIVALAGSCFLSGPRAQMKTMFHKRRKLASCGYLGSLVLTVAFAFRTGMTGQKQVMMFLMACQYLSIAAYCLSYVPFIDEILQVLYLKLQKIVRRKRNGGEEDEEEEENELPDFRAMMV